MKLFLLLMLILLGANAAYQIYGAFAFGLPIGIPAISIGVFLLILWLFLAKRKKLS